MSSWLKIKGTQTSDFQIGFDGPIIKRNGSNVTIRNGDDTANASIVANNITISGVYSGNATGLSAIPGANVSGQVPNASIANTVYGAIQSNITSVGTLATLSVAGNANVGGILTDNYYYANGAPVDFQQAAGSNGQVQFNSNGDFGASVNFTWDGTTNTLAATNFSGNGASLSSITAGNVVGQVANALIAGTVYGAQQGNITSVGTLSGLSVSGNAVITGNLAVNGNITYVNVETLQVQDPIIELGGGPNGAPLTTNDGKDRGSLLHYYTVAPVDAFMGWDNSNGEFAFGSNVSVTNDVVTYNTLGNVRANSFIGRLVGTSDFADVANSVSGSNVSGQVGNALVAGTVYGAAQGNITSVGTLSSLSVTGVANIGNVGNVKITGGSNGYILTTDGAGNLNFVEPISGASAWKAKTTTITSGSSSTTTIMTLPVGAIVDRASIIVDTPFNGTAPTLTVGLQGGTGFEYIGIGDANIRVGDRYDVPSQIAASGSTGTIQAYLSTDGSTSGSCRVLITYCIPE